MFEEAVRHDPQHYWAWLAWGHALAGVGLDDRAAGCFNACVALKPDLDAASYNRGLCRFRRGEYAVAVADFSKTLDLHPEHEKARIARGRAFQESGQWAEAEADFTAALDGGSTETRPYFLRAAVRKQRGDHAGAARDHAEGMKRTPTDELSWVTRGLARSEANDAAGALADYDEALKLNPRSYAALMNKANALDEKLHREADAIRVLDAIVELHPHQLAARSGRAVLLARQGNRTAALADAEYCRKANPDREVTYQLAGVFAVTSKSQPEDARTAYILLREALKEGYGFDLLPTDPDLDPLRKQPEFQQLLAAARTLRPSK